MQLWWWRLLFRIWPWHPILYWMPVSFWRRRRYILHNLGHLVFFIEPSYAHSRFGHYFHSNLNRFIPRGVKKSDFFLQIKLLNSCSKIDPKRQKLRKSVKIEKEKMSKNPVLLPCWIFCNLWSILVHHNSNVQWMQVDFDTSGVPGGGSM